MPTPPGFARCSYELRSTAITRSAYLTFGVDCAGTDPNAVASSCAMAFASAGSLFTAIDQNVTLVATRAALGTDGGEDIVGISQQLVGCTRSLSSTPPNCAVLVHKTTARGGRRGRGRMYIPWAASVVGVTEGGALQAADVTAMQNAVNAWLASINSLAGPLVLLHSPSQPGTAHPTTPGVPNPVTSLRVDPLIATQRRRLGR